MLAIDSSVLIRYIVRDDPAQTALADAFVEEELTGDDPGLITIGALLETVWVLRAIYGYSRDQVARIAAMLLQVRQFVIADRIAVERAIELNGPGLADAIIHELGRAAGCAGTVTFDKAFARTEGVRLLGRRSDMPGDGERMR